MILSDLSYYEGEFYEGLFHGNGVFCISSSPMVYSGGWKAGKKHGACVLRLKFLIDYSLLQGKVGCCMSQIIGTMVSGLKGNDKVLGLGITHLRLYMKGCGGTTFRMVKGAWLGKIAM